MAERVLCELLVAHYRPHQARHLLGTVRMLILYGEEAVVRRGWISREGLKTIRRDLHLAGVPWPLTGDDREAARAGE